MLGEIKKYIIIAVIGAALYFLMAYHLLIFSNTDIEPLKKVKLTLEQTFVQVGDIGNDEFRGPEFFLEIDELRKAGIGEVFVEREILTEEQRFQMELEIESYMDD